MAQKQGRRNIYRRTDWSAQSFRKIILKIPARNDRFYTSWSAPSFEVRTKLKNVPTPLNIDEIST